MITVSIGGMDLPLEKTNEGWINQMIAEARKHGNAPCVRVRVKVPGADIALATPGCSSGGGGRAPNALEGKIRDAWQKRGLQTGQFSPGELRAFLNGLVHLT
jgi:hypothetical protein